ncbi:MAG TPA: NUDIX domain-containing protein [Candidatus Limnocylindria bacterium]|nr:NUDIX domain-containing protein [Candidatus Limnocylindria bacterium]
MTVTSSDIHGTKYQVALDQLEWRPAAYAIVIQNDKILLTRQHGVFHLPGGGVEFGEMPDEAVVREAREETGAVIANPKLVGCISGFFTWYDGKKDTHVQSILLYYHCDFVGGELSTDGFMDDEKEIGEMPEWVALKDLDTITAGSTIDWRRVVKDLVKQFNK